MQIVLNRKTFIRNKIPLIFSKLKYFLSLSLSYLIVIRIDKVFPRTNIAANHGDCAVTLQESVASLA